MKLFAGLEKIVENDVPLDRYTWMGLGGKAPYFVQPTTIEELAEVARRCRENEVPVHVMGGGANLLIDDAGVRGASRRRDRRHRLRSPGLPHVGMMTPMVGRGCVSEVSVGGGFNVGNVGSLIITTA